MKTRSSRQQKDDDNMVMAEAYSGPDGGADKDRNTVAVEKVPSCGCTDLVDEAGEGKTGTPHLHFRPGGHLPSTSSEDSSKDGQA